MVRMHMQKPLYALRAAGTPLLLDPIAVRAFCVAFVLRSYLHECTKSDAERTNVATDARFLIAKCCYAQGQYEQALEHLDQVRGLGSSAHYSIAKVLKTCCEQAIFGIETHQTGPANRLYIFLREELNA